MTSKRPSSARPTPARRSSSSERRTSISETPRKKHEDLEYECKVAYVMVLEDVKEEVTSRTQLRNCKCYSVPSKKTKHDSFIAIISFIFTLACGISFSVNQSIILLKDIHVQLLEIWFSVRFIFGVHFDIKSCFLICSTPTNWSKPITEIT